MGIFKQKSSSSVQINNIKHRASIGIIKIIMDFSQCFTILQSRGQATTTEDEVCACLNLPKKVSSSSSRCLCVIVCCIFLEILLLMLQTH